ncbi:transcriptional repressor [uncultured Sanguibacteroides sp.]|uniref:transcriptional repressor n=1 Tax=uncultured Sanguibacteroides sp. TaxID=1635151 RepID=UPI0034268362
MKISAAGKVTFQRIAVYKMMQERCLNSIDKITAKIKLPHPDIMVSIIYRIMDSFCEAGLLRFTESHGKTMNPI